MKGLDAYYQTQLNRHQAAIDAADLIELHQEGNMKYRQLKLGDAFTFMQGGFVYVRCRGGYRPGCGGELVKFNYPDMPVFSYS